MTTNVKTLKIDGDLHKKLKMAALEAGVSLQELVNRMMSVFLARKTSSNTEFDVKDFTNEEVKAILSEDKNCNPDLVVWAQKYATLKKGCKN